MAYVEWMRDETDSHIVRVVLNRPEVMNAFNTQMAREFIKVMQEISTAPDVRVVGLFSSSSKAFCTGADLKERNGMTDKEWHEQHKIFEAMFYSLADLKMPTIAVLDGFVLAGGMELALNCDLWIAADTAVFGLPEATRGIMPGGGGTRILSRRIGMHFAKEILFTGQRYSAQRAKEMGLLNRLVTRQELPEAFLELAKQISANAPLSVQYCKSAVEELRALPDDLGRDREIAWYEKCVDTEDRYEGVHAFNEKRPPNFTGR